ncbi:DUF397 domain-containing protein [Actinocorallia sp. B10E7]|uniref:DUF397 domain-containing protein n=1 Tax=Actinocorallia sp. B10E7 TaxID=3153558 RepID=UPI00325C822E
MEAERPYVYTETTGGGTLASAPDRVRGFQMAFKRIGAKALNEGDTVALSGIRDSKHPEAPHLTVSRSALAALVQGVKDR